MADTETPDRCQCGEDHENAIPPDEAEFFDALVKHMLNGDAPVSPVWMAGACAGYTLRRHVNEAHPDQVEFVAERHAPTGETRDGWLFGYRFEHQQHKPRGGHEPEREHPGDARGGRGNGAGSDGNGPGSAYLYVVGDEELRAAQALGRDCRDKGGDYLWTRLLEDGRGVFLLPMIGGGVRVCIGRGSVEFDDVWCYPADQDGCVDAGWRAALAWNGQGEPEGWYRHPESGRRRPGGDAGKEFVRP